LQSPLNEQAIVAAFLRVRTLVASGSPVSIEEARELEQVLRPTASAAVVQQVVVPLLDRAELHSLAMAWDSGGAVTSPSWLLARVERWLKLGAPEIAFLTLAEMRRAGASGDEVLERASAQLDAARAPRAERLERNLSALSTSKPDLVDALRRYPRMSVALQPLGAGMAEYSNPGGPLAQIWAATPSDACDEAERLVRGCANSTDSFIAGVGDCTLPAAAAKTAASDAGSAGDPSAPASNRRVHLIEPNLARLRALFELVDLAAMVRDERMSVYGGVQAVSGLAACFPRGLLLQPEAVIGADATAIAMLRLIAAPAATP
jgi:hypothetical protein